MTAQRLKPVLRACHKRPISAERITDLIDSVETEIFNMEEREIPSSVIGEIVMDKLKRTSRRLRTCVLHPFTANLKMLIRSWMSSKRIFEIDCPFCPEYDIIQAL